jgi:hypothetical protein
MPIRCRPSSAHAPYSPSPVTWVSRLCIRDVAVLLHTRAEQGGREVERLGDHLLAAEGIAEDHFGSWGQRLAADELAVDVDLGGGANEHRGQAHGGSAK